MHRLGHHFHKLIFLGVLTLLVAANHTFLFVTPWHEDGDFAVNALQIERAGHFNEVYGNYSRFHFNHPGPAFFYVYAAGEAFFFDWLQIVPTPHNAHALTGLILQTFFFSCALSIAAGWVRSRWFLPLALLLAGIHFRFASGAFTSIWPPDVLLMPFLCFLVAGASTAAGRARHLPLTVLCGCFLVHGHVAQPLFVGSLFIVIYLCFVRTDNATGWPNRAFLARHRLIHILSAACIALFLLPFAVDLLDGADSNIATIIRFMQSGEDAHKTLLQATAYLVSFFAYLQNQDSFLLPDGTANLSFITARALWFLPWAVILPVIAWTVIRALRKNASAEPDAPFRRTLGLLVGAGLLITIPWGVLQAGEMFEFNGRFYHALIYGLLLLFATALAGWLRERRGALLFGTLACAAGAVCYWQGSKLPASSVNAPHDWVDRTAAAMRADPNPTATKFFIFGNDSWGDVAKTALAIKRLGGSYRVDGNWSFMFGRYRTYRPNPTDFNLQGMSVWRFVRHSHSLPGASATLSPQLKVSFEPSPLTPEKIRIDCSHGGNLSPYILFGFTSPDGDFAWSNLPQTALMGRSSPVTRDVVLTIDAEPFVNRSHELPAQPMILHVNGQQIASFEIESRQTVTATIPRDIWNRQADVILFFSFPKAQSPLELGLSADPRKLGWAFYSLGLDLAAP